MLARRLIVLTPSKYDCSIGLCSSVVLTFWWMGDWARHYAVGWLAERWLTERHLPRASLWLVLRSERCQCFGVCVAKRLLMRYHLRAKVTIACWRGSWVERAKRLILLWHSGIKLCCPLSRSRALLLTGRSHEINSWRQLRFCRCIFVQLIFLHIPLRAM